MKLNEIAYPSGDKDWSKTKIKEFLNTFHMSYNIHKDGVDLYNSFASPMEWSRIPFKIKTVTGSFSLSYTYITDLSNGPDIVAGNFNLVGCRRLTTIEHLPQQIYGMLKCYDTGINSFHNIHKYLKRLDGELQCNLVTNMLGILFIKNLPKIRINYETSKSLQGDNWKEFADKCERVERLFNEALRTGEDVHSFQEKLIEMGYGEQAKI